MKSLMRIYFSYIATALAIIAAFVVLQVVLLGIVTSKLYEDESGGGRYAIARVYQAMDGDGLEAVACLQEMGASFAMLLDDTGTPVWNYRLPQPRRLPLSHAGIWMTIRFTYGEGKRGSW